MGRMNRLMQTANDTLALKSRPWDIDASKLLLLGIAGIAALAIVGLLTMIVWMSLRTGVPGQLSLYNLNKYTLLLTDPYSYRVMMTTLGFAGGTIAVSVPFGFVDGLTLTPLACVMIAAALRGMNPALVEAASIHGVSKFKSLLRVELPLIWPALISAVIWMLTVTIAAFDVPGVIGMANNIFTFSTAVYFIINPNEGLPRYGLSGAYGTIMVGVSLILMIPYFMALTHSHRYQIISGQSYQSRPVELGRWWLFGWGLLGLYLVLAFILPLLAISWVS